MNYELKVCESEEKRDAEETIKTSTIMVNRLYLHKTIFSQTQCFMDIIAYVDITVDRMQMSTLELSMVAVFLCN